MPRDAAERSDISALPNYGKVVQTLSVGGRNETHHSEFTDDRHHLWASDLDTSKIFIFDGHSDPSKPSLHKTIDYFVARGWQYEQGDSAAATAPERVILPPPLHLRIANQVR